MGNKTSTDKKESVSVQKDKIVPDETHDGIKIRVTAVNPKNGDHKFNLQEIQWREKVTEKEQEYELLKFDKQIEQLLTQVMSPELEFDTFDLFSPQIEGRVMRVSPIIQQYVANMLANWFIQIDEFSPWNDRTGDYVNTVVVSVTFPYDDYVLDPNRLSIILNAMQTLKKNDKKVQFVFTLNGSKVPPYKYAKTKFPPPQVQQILEQIFFLRYPNGKSLQVTRDGPRGTIQFVSLEKLAQQAQRADKTRRDDDDDD
jgi:hypothetical protein